MLGTLAITAHRQPTIVVVDRLVPIIKVVGFGLVVAVGCLEHLDFLGHLLAVSFVVLIHSLFYWV
jgi:hypothetical protein